MAEEARNSNQDSERAFTLRYGWTDQVGQVNRVICLRDGEMRRQGHPDTVAETTIAKYFSSKVAMEVAVDAVQAHGGNGCTGDYPGERLFREAKSLEIL